MATVTKIDAQLWSAPSTGTGTLDPGRLAGVPSSARAYLARAIAPGEPLASRVRLRMRGEIRLRGWLPFEADEVIHRDRGMIWRASVRMAGLPVRGFDRLIDGVGAQRWRLLGLIPVMSASGPDVTRSAIGRWLLESIWLPSMLAADDVSWTGSRDDEAVAELSRFGETVALRLGLAADGRLRSVAASRWGDPDGDGSFRLARFGGVVEDETTFGTHTIPSRLRAGWHFGSDRFVDGEFFRVTIHDATFR